MPKRRGRPRSTLPTGAWDDDEVDSIITLASDVVDRRDERTGEALDALKALTARALGRPPTVPQVNRLRALLYGGLRTRRQDDKPDRTQPSKASAIARQIVAWQYGINVRDVRWMRETLNTARDPTDRNKNKDKRDLTGQPVLHGETGQPMLHEDGTPATHKPRPRVKLIYR
jgi:hypothetical protein